MNKLNNPILDEWRQIRKADRLALMYGAGLRSGSTLIDSTTGTRETLKMFDLPEPRKGESRRVVNPSASIHGVQQCCSAAILHGLSGWGQGVTYTRHPTEIMKATPYKKCRTYAQYMTHYKKVKLVHPDMDHAYMWVLEQVYTKAKTGYGGNNMYASQSYATKTWFIADRRRQPSSFSCMNFMLWLKNLGVQKVGRIHISPYADGAHGGQCKGGVYTPNLPRIRELRDEALAKLNEHAKKVFELYDLPTDGTTAIENEPATDKVGELW